MHETKQVYYNQVKGQITEINNTENFPSVVLEVGHDNKRFINICFKPNLIEKLSKQYKVGDYVGVHFFVSSRFKHGRWYTMANALDFNA
jgi:hypothetical protein